MDKQYLLNSVQMANFVTDGMLIFDAVVPEEINHESMRELDAKEIKGALLTSTIVSSTRRAALINDRMYNEGSQFKFEGQTFAVERILPDRVKLTQEGVVYYLTIPSRFDISR